MILDRHYRRGLASGEPEAGRGPSSEGSPGARLSRPGAAVIDQDRSAAGDVRSQDLRDRSVSGPVTLRRHLSQRSWTLLAVDVDGFWKVVERARAAAGRAADQARRDGQPSAVTEVLVAELARLPLPQIVAFDGVLSDVLAQADSWDACAACWIIEHGFLSDDGFADFRAGLVGLGRSTFEAVVKDPDSLAGHPAVQEISGSEGRGLWIGDETLLHAAQEAYERLTGDPDAFWDAADTAEPATATPSHSPAATDERWDLRNEDEWRRRLPRLTEMFLAHRFPLE